MEHRTKPVVIIGFRGTQIDKGEDILADLKIIRKDLDGYGAVHRGFKGAYEEIRQILEKKLQAESGRGLKLWVTGHSLGAALGTLASTSILDHLKAHPGSYEFEGLYTFGQPRVGNQTFVEKVEEGYTKHDVSVMRFRHGDDLVTRIPWIALGYHHAGHLIHLTGEGTLDVDPEELDPGKTTTAEGFLDDHGMDSQYYPRIAGHVEEFPELSHHCP